LEDCCVPEDLGIRVLALEYMGCGFWDSSTLGAGVTWCKVLVGLSGEHVLGDVVASSITYVHNGQDLEGLLAAINSCKLLSNNDNLVNGFHKENIFFWRGGFLVWWYHFDLAFVLILPGVCYPGRGREVPQSWPVLRKELPIHTQLQLKSSRSNAE